MPTLSLARLLMSQHHVMTEFRNQPAVCAVGGAAASTSDTGVNVVAFHGATFEALNIGAQSAPGPILSAAGVDWSLAQTNTKGVEITHGITGRGPGSLVAGQNAGFVKATFAIQDVSGTAVCALGFRVAAAYDPDHTAYTDYAVMNVNAGDVKSETRLASATADVTTLPASWADGEAHTLSVNVAQNGAVTYEFDQSQPPQVTVFDFAANTILIPFFHFLQASDLTHVTFSYWEAGRKNEEL